MVDDVGSGATGVDADVVVWPPPTMIDPLSPCATRQYEECIVDLIVAHLGSLFICINANAIAERQ